MGAHAGTFFFDGRPGRGACCALRSGLEPIAPDGVSVHAEDGVAMAHGAFHVWTGDRSCEQPWQSPAGFVATWDGRLDNRDDLLLRLGQPLGDDVSDVGLALAAFERWGIEGLRFLIGDWSLAIWDRDHRMLHLARDYMGIRPLYYCATDTSVMWSSSLGELAERAHRTDAISEEFVARFVALRFSSDVTPYQGIRAVPTASCVIFASSPTETRRRFWQFDPGTVRFRDKREYEERLRELWTDAVGTRLRTDRVVWAEVSGAFDSSSVVCMADRLMQAARVPARQMQLISHATLRSPDGDERRFIAEIESQTGRCSDIIGVEDHGECIDADWNWVTPFASRGVGLATVQRVRERGGRLILSGRAGDAVMGGQPDNSQAVFDDLDEGRVLAAMAGVRAWSRACRQPFVEIAWNLWRGAVQPRHGVDTSRQDESRLTGLTLLAPRVRSMLDDDAAELAGVIAEIRPAKREMVRMLLGYARLARFDVPNPPPGVIYTYPFTHRPLVDFMLAIPGAEVSAPGNMRSLMRRAFAGFMPSRILRRTSKGYYPPSAMRAVRQLAASMSPVDSLEVVRRGWVNAQRLDVAIRGVMGGAGERGVELRPILQLEQWIASRDRRGPAVIPQRKEVNSYGVLNA
ncbi:MAG TPA: asparagine synthase-related protein [Vicinamibacterales bacterium]|nr:asparagine synthase-related protein [Vicinamibacterales bacterium]